MNDCAASSVARLLVLAIATIVASASPARAQSETPKGDDQPSQSPKETKPTESSPESEDDEELSGTSRTKNADSEPSNERDATTSAEDDEPEDEAFIEAQIDSIEREVGGSSNRNRSSVSKALDPDLSVMFDSGFAWQSDDRNLVGGPDRKHSDGSMKRARSFAEECPKKECVKTANNWKKKFESLPESRRAVVVYHDSLEYVIDGLGLSEATTVEPRPGVEPNPKHVAKVVATTQQRQIPTILKLEYYPSATPRQVAEKTDTAIVPPQGQTQTDDDYGERIDRLARSLYETLSP